MLDENNYRVIAASVPQPRKNKRIIHGKFNVLDFIVIIPAIGVFVALLLTASWPFWVTIIILFAIVLVVGFLIWPLSFLGKEKIYIYLARAIGYVFKRQRYSGSEDRADRSEEPPESNEPRKGPRRGVEEQIKDANRGGSLPPDMWERLSRRRSRNGK